MRVNVHSLYGILFINKYVDGVTMMFTKTKTELGEESAVRFINGLVSFGPVNLNVYCFEVDGVLIDSGSQTLLSNFKPFFADADIDQLVLTHNHEDHTGGAAFIQQTYGIPISIHPMSVDTCTHKANYPFYRKLFWGKRAPFQAQPLGDTFESRTATWDVIHTPGHAEDHLAFLNKETGQLFSGDLYVHPKTKVVLRNESTPTMIASLTNMLTYDFAEIFCCHAGYVKDGRQALMNKLEYLSEFQEKVLDFHRQGLTEKQIQQKMFRKKYPITYLSFGEWDSMHMIRSIIADVNIS